MWTGEVMFAVSTRYSYFMIVPAFSTVVANVLSLPNDEKTLRMVLVICGAMHSPKWNVTWLGNCPN